MWWLRQLLSPLCYLKIRLGPGWVYQSKRLYDYVLPVIFGGLTSLGYFLLQHQPALLGDHGLLNSVSGLLQLLVAFYIAALAAVATFPRDSMELPLRGDPALLARWSNDQQKMVDIDLSRRQFVCHLFGYLAFVSLILFLAIIFANAAWTDIKTDFSPSVIFYAKPALSTLFWIALWNLIIQTLLGLYFLGDRMQHEK